ncbi:MAG: DNA methyltransferase [Piscirickettsiaceae bacterium CG_4_9_14_3_um_filter_43_564]|nr:SAM-dependent DNA methyltransferase [Thiomicrospira sp.]OIP95217.1 MAG: DNA methyltransferase [Thiomicrospira sp. CG2_30_44_34]PIQ03903.1 MAG: DNA methyltransferase [Piscirickettsiaceae bacterium CG18_big_fil_WC_8_21_14_2_50_44_103]PIU38457.1 MAG: DNA methyltransferase [Piscirickettsiaceae bacterium CG07_land_8_20_14_0_80_44_28]PIW57903.1 MAG: DNA methyltransferase [Piscirickettsiaceae bacterium CG12_big_fil_rev_8_21_14_0_65_44_934]PIW77440.1 MAG: DNA methyltransferase [Piscirickettsiaceae 
MSEQTASTIVNKVWNYAHVLRDDGVGYGDYVEQITYLIFLKMADERAEEGLNDVGVPEAYQWSNLVKADGDDLEIQYRHTLEHLGKMGGMLGTIFRKSQNKIQDPAKLERLIKMIDKESWATLPVDVKGDIYEGLLERNAQDVKGGAGQYFTPRALIEAMVEVMQPKPTDVVADPATGTGGFLLAAHDYMAKQVTSKAEAKHLKNDALRGNDIVDSVVRLCAMNLYLHGIGGTECPIVNQDALAKEVTDKVDMVLANPPFGKRSSITVMSEKSGKAEMEKLTYEREDFWATTSNKQLNFVQHIANMLKVNGKAAVVVPDNVMFEGGAGETIRKTLLERTNVHTLLRLPTGIFYANGVKANVIFFDAKPASKTAWTKQLWVYDFRTNVHKTLKQNRLTKNDFAEFIELYKAGDLSQRQATWSSESLDGRWRAYDYAELIARDKTNLDIFWLKDKTLEDSENLPAPEVLAAEIVEQLEAALTEFKEVENLLG